MSFIFPEFYNSPKKVSHTAHTATVYFTQLWITMIHYPFHHNLSSDLPKAEANIAGKFGEEAKVGYVTCDVSSRVQVESECPITFFYVQYSKNLL